MTKTQDHTNPVPLSGGPKGALASRGANTAARALRRLSSTARAALRRGTRQAGRAHWAGRSAAASMP
jgi:hypothetical protein